MSENGVAPAPPEDDRTPTQEDLAPIAVPEPASWVMPQPVFRRSDGFTPRVAFGGNEDETVTPDNVVTSLEHDAVPAEAEVAEQPDITEEPNLASADADAVAVPTKKKRSWLRIFLIVVGIVLLVAAATTIIAMVALGYFLQVSESQNLN
jgi:hypothetical protein